MKPSAHVLLVEDDEIIASIIEDFLISQNFQVCVRADGQRAWEHLQDYRGGYDIILLDRHLPGMDGMELLRHLKSDMRFAQIPVIFETGRDDNDSVREGLEQGGYYYLTKPIQLDLMLAAINAALQQSRELRGMLEKVRLAERPTALLQTGVFRFRDLEEGKLLANYLARACPEPERTILGLQELLINAVEHGNLSISYSEKSALILAGSWQDEVQRRLRLPEFRDRYVEVGFQRLPDSLCFTIQDQGDGFDWLDYLDFSPERAFDLHGRGIAMARKLSFDHLQYQGNGSTVFVACKRSAP